MYDFAADVSSGDGDDGDNNIPISQKAKCTRSNVDRELDGTSVEKMKKNHPHSLINEEIMDDETIKVLQESLINNFSYPTITDESKKQSKHNKIEDLLDLFKEEVNKVQTKKKECIYFNIEKETLKELYRWPLFDSVSNVMDPINYRIYEFYYKRKRKRKGKEVGGGKQIKKDFRTQMIHSHYNIAHRISNNKYKDSDSHGISFKDMIEKTEKIFNNTMTFSFVFDNCNNNNDVILISVFEWNEARPFQFILGFRLCNKDYKELKKYMKTQSTILNKSPNHNLTKDTNSIIDDDDDDDIVDDIDDNKLYKFIFDRNDIINTNTDDTTNLIIRSCKLYYINFGFTPRD